MLCFSCICHLYLRNMSTLFVALSDFMRLTNSSCTLQHMFIYIFEICDNKPKNYLYKNKEKKREIIKSTRSPKKLKFDNIG